MKLEEYREKCDEIGFIPDLAVYRGLKEIQSEDLSPTVPEYTKSGYQRVYDWTEDFELQLKDTYRITTDNLMTVDLIQNAAHVVLDKIQLHVGISALLDYLSPKCAYVIQNQDFLEDAVAPASYVVYKVVSDAEEILTGFYLHSPFQTMKCDGKFRLMVLHKRCNEALTRYSAAFKIFQESLDSIVKAENYTNFNNKLRKMPIIVTSASSEWLAAQLAAVIGGITHESGAENAYLGNYVLFEGTGDGIERFFSRAFIVSTLNFDMETPADFELCFDRLITSPELSIKIFVRKQLQKEAALSPNENAVDISVESNIQVPIDSNLIFKTLFLGNNPSPKQELHCTEMYEFIKTLTGIDQSKIREIIQNAMVDDEILEQLKSNNLRAQSDSGRIPRFVKEFSRFEHRAMNGMQFNNMVDLGCGDGLVSAAIAEHLGIAIENAIGIDVRDIREAEIQYIQSDLEQELLLPNKSCQLFTVFEVLHHIKNWRSLVDRVFQCLETGGFFLIRESLVQDYVDCLTLDVQHALYAVLNGEMSSVEYVTEFSTWYIHKNELLEELERKGFRIVEVEKDYEQDKFNKFWILCQKRDSISVNLKE